MPMLIKPMRTGELASCSPGELVAFDNGAGRVQYAVFCYLTEEDDLAVLATIRPSDQDAPYMTRLHKVNDCILLGTDWVFELAMPPTGFGFESDNGQDAGIVRVSGAGAIMRIGRNPADPHLKPGHLDLSTMQLCGAPMGGYSVAVHTWKVWLSIEERNRFNGEPLFRFSANKIDFA